MIEVIGACALVGASVAGCRSRITAACFVFAGLFFIAQIIGRP